MNYYQSRPLKDGSGFHFTCLNKRIGTWPVGYCAEHEWAHETEEEAQECFRQYVLDTATVHRIEDADTLHRCEYGGCLAHTADYVMIDQEPVSLCEKHQDRDSLEDCYHRVGAIASSY